MGVDMLFILLLALILFGPKRLPEIARQIGKFVAEFKRASNDFKYQLQAEIDKADSGAQKSSPSTPTLSPSTPETGAPGIPLLPPSEGAPSASSAEAEHERLMRTARMAYEAQAFTLRPPEPPPVAHAAPPMAGEPSPPAEPVSVPSASNSAPAGDSHPQSVKSGQIGGPAEQGS